MSEKDFKPRYKLSLAQKGVRVLQTLAFSAAASLIPPDPVQAQSGIETTSTQNHIDPTTIGPSSDLETPLLAVSIGATSDEEVRRFPYGRRRELNDGFVSYAFDSLLTNRPHLVVTRDRTVFKRKLMAPLIGGEVSVSRFLTLYGNPELVVSSDVTGFSVEGDSLNSWETHIFAGAGAAVVTHRGSQLVYEVHAFEPTTPDKYIELWGKGDYGG